MLLSKWLPTHSKKTKDTPQDSRETPIDAQPGSFPQEVFELIIDTVGVANDRSTLTSCNGVSLAFSHRARRHLFSQVVLDNFSADRLTKLGEITVPKPVRNSTMSGIGPYVQTLIIDISTRESLPDICEPLLMAIMDSLNTDKHGYGIQELVMITVTVEFRADTQPALWKTFLDLLHSHRLQTVSMYGMHYFSLQDLQYSHIKHFSIEQHTNDTPFNTPLNISKLPKLESFSTDFSFSTHTGTFQARNLSLHNMVRTLKKFSGIIRDFTHIAVAQAYLTENATTLQRIDLYFYRQCAVATSLRPIHIDHYPQLQTLRLSFHNQFEGDNGTLQDLFDYTYHILKDNNYVSDIQLPLDLRLSFTVNKHQTRIVLHNMLLDLALDGSCLLFDDLLTGPYFSNRLRSLHLELVTLPTLTSGTDQRYPGPYAYVTNPPPIFSYILPRVHASQVIVTDSLFILP